MYCLRCRHKSCSVSLLSLLLFTCVRTSSSECMMAVAPVFWRISFFFLASLWNSHIESLSFRPFPRRLLTSSSNCLVRWQSSFDDLDLGESMFGGNGVNKQNANTEKRAIFVGNLPFTVTNDGLKMLAESNGVSPEAIMSARIATKFNTGRSRGFGYLEFSSESVASQNLKR